MEESKKVFLQIKAQYISELWVDFAKYHELLFDLTCEEYVLLLESNMDHLDEKIQQKQELIEDIKKLDLLRKETVLELNKKLGVNIKNISDLKDFLNKSNLSAEATRIENTNLILSDIIEKIQQQNKKNQVYLNKALQSLQDLKESFNGKKYKTYGPGGQNRTSVTK